jgi:hypothetical protein
MIMIVVVLFTSELQDATGTAETSGVDEVAAWDATYAAKACDYDS